MEQTSQKITLYTGTMCPKCMFIKSRLVDKLISYETINIDHNDEARESLREQGFQSLPILQIGETLHGDYPTIAALVEEL